MGHCPHLFLSNFNLVSYCKRHATSTTFEDNACDQGACHKNTFYQACFGLPLPEWLKSHLRPFQVVMLDGLWRARALLSQMLNAGESRGGMAAAGCGCFLHFPVCIGDEPFARGHGTGCLGSIQESHHCYQSRCLFTPGLVISQDDIRMHLYVRPGLVLISSALHRIICTTATWRLIWKPMRCCNFLKPSGRPSD